MGIYSQVRAPHWTLFQVAFNNTHTHTPEEENGSGLAETVDASGAR